MNTSHLNALELAISHERCRLSNAHTSQEKRLRQVLVAQYEKEVAAEKTFLGIVDEPVSLSEADLLKELLG